MLSETVELLSVENIEVVAGAKKLEEVFDGHDDDGGDGGDCLWWYFRH